MREENGMGKVKSRARIIVPCRFGYLHCWRANSFGNGNEKYSVSAIISKDDKETLKEIEEAIEYVKEHSIAKWGGRIPVTLRTPLHDGDLEKPDHAAFANAYYINAKSGNKPQVVNELVEPITNESEVYSGCYGKVSMIFYGYNYQGNRGIGACLCHIQKLKDGEPLCGNLGAKDDFKPENYLV